MRARWLLYLSSCRYYMEDADIKKKWSKKTTGLIKEAMAEEGVRPASSSTSVAPVGVNSTSPAHSHVRPTGVHRTCR